jgi:Flp pilus assembly protein TadB
VNQLLLALALLGAAAALWSWSPGPQRLARLNTIAAPPNRRRMARPRAFVGRRRAAPTVPVSDLLLAMELLAAALDAGAPPMSALETVAGALTGPLSISLRSVATAMRLGADVRSAWQDVPLARSDGPLADLARVMSRVDEGGARVAASVRRLAAREAERAHGRALTAARRAGVFAVAPLGFCFLPAFVLLAVVPVVAGAAHQVLLP